MEKIYIGTRTGELHPGLESLPVSKVEILNENGEIVGVAGDDNGRVLTAENPDGTNAMAADILASVTGYVYRPYEAEDALIDPAAELGDGVTIGGVYSVLANENITFDSLYSSGISAPGTDEIEDEYPYLTESQRIKRAVAGTRSLITKTAEQIRLEVANKVEGLSSSFTVELDEIRSEVSGKIDETKASSLISQKMDSIKLSVSSKNGSTTFTLTGGGAELSAQTLSLSVDAVNISGKLTANQIDATNLKVNAANITGTLYVGDLYDDVGLVTENNVTTITNNAIRTAELSADQIVTGTLDAAYLELNGLLALTYRSSIYGYMGVNTAKGGPVICDDSMSVFFVTTNNAAKMSYYEENMIWVASGGCYSSEAMQVYSDRRLKTSISYELEAEEQLFAALRPCSFQMIGDTSERKHWGFIAQDVIQSVRDAGMDSTKLAAIGSYEDMNTLAYSELTALNTYMIQKLMARVAELEARL